MSNAKVRHRRRRRAEKRQAAEDEFYRGLWSLESDYVPFDEWALRRQLMGLSAR